MLTHSDFALATALDDDAFTLLDWPLCRVLLMNDAQYPWIILVPRVNQVCELHQLNSEQQQQLFRESNAVSEVLMASFTPTTLNVAALGNVVSQLHIHHVARFKTDIAWPKPIWGQYPVKPYDKVEKDNVSNLLITQLKEKDI